MNKIYQLGEEITFLEIKYRLLKNKSLIGIFTILSIFISSLIAFNQETYFEGKMYFAGNLYEKNNDNRSSSKRININDINPSVRRFLLDTKKIEALMQRIDNVVYELAQNPIILKRVFSDLESKNVFNQGQLQNFNLWSKKFSFSDKYADSEFLGIFFIGKSKKLVNYSLNTLKKEILESPEYKQKMKGLVLNSNPISNRNTNKLVINQTFLGPSLEEISSTNKFAIIFIGTFFGISIISLISIYRDSLMGIISNQKKFVDLIPYPLLRNFPIKEKYSWDKGLKLLNQKIQIQDSNICLITISRIFPDELNYLKDIFFGYAKNSDILISKNINLDNNYPKNILIVYPNKITEEDLLILIQDLNNSGKNIIGWIYLY